jgi:hypothetical protein
MKRFLSVLPILLMLLVLALPGTSAQAQPPEYPAELAYYDAQIDVMIPRLNAFQAEYYAANGRYYQALESHTAAPDVPTIPDGIESSPSDQPETLAYFWDVFAELPDVLAWSFRIDTYSGPNGDGYVLVVSTVINGDTWERSVNHGPDTYRAEAWHQHISEE